MLLSSIINEKTVVFVFLLLFSTLGWVYVNMQGNYTTTHTIPLKFENLPTDKIPLKPIPKLVNMNIEGMGSELLWNTLGFGSDELILDYNNYIGERVITADEVMAILNTSIIGYNIINLKPDTLFIELDDGMKKKIPIELLHNIKFKEGYTFADNISFYPDSIVVSGPRKIIDTLTKWQTDLLDLTDVSKFSSGYVNLKKPSNTIIFDETTVNYEFSVEQLTEITLKDIPIEIEEYDFREYMIISPTSAELTFVIPISEVKNVDASLFRIIADFKSVNIAEQTKVSLKIAEQPDIVNSVRLKPNIVDFRLKTK